MAKQVVSIAVFDEDGGLLFGKRRDNGLWTMPGGHVEPGETPEEAAPRELEEEAGVKAKLMSIGSETIVGRDGKEIEVHCYTATVPTGTKSSSENDPDEECAKWEFVPTDDGLPDNVLQNLHSPRNVTLQILGLQEQGELKKNDTMDLPDFLRDLINPIRYPFEDELERIKTLPVEQRDEAERAVVDQTLSHTPDAGQLKRLAEHLHGDALDRVLHHPAATSEAAQAAFARANANYNDANSRRPKTFAEKNALDEQARRAEQDLARVGKAPAWSPDDLQDATHAYPHLVRHLLANPSYPPEATKKDALNMRSAIEVAVKNRTISPHLLDVVAPRFRDWVGSAQSKYLSHPNLSDKAIHAAVGTIKDRQDMSQLKEEAHSLRGAVWDAIIKNPTTRDGMYRLVPSGKIDPLLEEMKAAGDHDYIPNVLFENKNVEERHVDATIKDPLTRSQFFSELGNMTGRYTNPEDPIRRIPGALSRALNDPEISDADKETIVRSPGYTKAVSDGIQSPESMSPRLKQVLAGYPETSPDVIRKVVGSSDDPHLFSRVAQNMSTPSDVLEHLQDKAMAGWPSEGADMSSPEIIRRMILRHTNSTSNMVEREAQHPSPTDSLYMSRRIPEHAVDRLIAAPVSSKEGMANLRSLAANPSVAPERLHQLMLTHRNVPGVVDKVLDNKSADEVSHRWAIDNRASLPASAQSRVDEVSVPFLTKISPHLVYNESVEVPMAPKGVALGKIRAVRDRIEAAGGEAQPKTLPMGDWGMGRLPNGNISSKKLQEYIDSLPKSRWHVSHDEWSGAQRHSDENSKVFQLNYSSDHAQKMKKAGVLNTFLDMIGATKQSAHPVTDHIVGWVRYTGDPKNGIHVDEVQSDFGQSFVKQAAAAARNHAAATGDDPNAAEVAATSAAERRWPTAHQKQISDILFNGRHPNEVIADAFVHHLRSHGAHETKVQWHTPDTKAPLSDLSEGKPIPAHFHVSYGDVPKKLGAEPSTYGNMPTQDNPDLKGKPTWEFKVRKTEAPLSKALDYTTPEFQKWFEGSRATHEDGRPKIMFHGTSKDKDFKAFSVPKNGAWFTSDPSEASMYASENDSQDHKYKWDDATGRMTLKAVHQAPRVIPVHLSIKNPYLITPEDKASLDVDNYKRAQGQFFDQLRMKGHDGVDFGNGVMVAFHPHQIKSIHNTRPTEHKDMMKDEDADLRVLSPQLRQCWMAVVSLFLDGEDSSDGNLAVKLRHAMWEQDGDPVAAALVVADQEVSDENVDIVRAAMGMVSGRPVGLKKAEAPLPKGSAVEPMTGSAREVADDIKKHFGTIEPAHLDGKHSEGSYFVTGDLGVWFLKPGTGGTGPIEGVHDDHSPPSAREAAFWALGGVLGLQSDLSRSEWVRIDGKLYAAIHFLPSDFKSLIDEVQKPATLALLESYRVRGRLFQWSVLDFAAGNGDRHGHNLLVSDDEIRLIDHGSAFAGIHFDPAHDFEAFVPFYLRYTVPPSVRFNMLSRQEKLRYMPDLPMSAMGRMKAWLQGIDKEEVRRTLETFGIDPNPTLGRLAMLQEMGSNLSLNANLMWIT